MPLSWYPSPSCNGTNNGKPVASKSSRTIHALQVYVCYVHTAGEMLHAFLLDILLSVVLRKLRQYPFIRFTYKMYIIHSTQLQKTCIQLLTYRGCLPFKFSLPLENHFLFCNIMLYYNMHAVVTYGVPFLVGITNCVL